MKQIPLTKGQVALVDDDDYEYLSKFKWCAVFNVKTAGFYATRNVPIGGNKQSTVRMHRFIMNAKKGQQVDHGNHQTLDNRKDNLRLTNNQGNQKNRKRLNSNTSGFCGVYWRKDKKLWHASIGVNGVNRHLGYYAEKADAIKAREAANIKYGFHKNHGKAFDWGIFR